ncbi:MAG: hypothetical protein RLZZ148_933 [Cyanobacteriota bacterium]
MWPLYWCQSNMGINQDMRHILVVEDQKSKRIVSLKENSYSIGRDPTSSGFCLTINWRSP